MKHIVICADGTWNRPNLFSNGVSLKTNVERMYQSVTPTAADPAIVQVRFYESGVGSSTYDKIDQILGGVKGYGIDQKIRDLYTFLLMHYETGDKIFLFGFSRGAYTVRSLAGMVRNCGILKPEYLHLVDNAYRYYRDRNPHTLPDSDFMKAFRENYCTGGHVPEIHFIGVWDTVGSLGFPVRFFRIYNNNKYKFHDVRLNSYVRNAFHAVAVDEKRGPFAPTLWEMSPNAKGRQVLEQMWFAGAHSNVGGGYPDCGLSDVALQWMMDKAEGCGLGLRIPDDLKCEPNPDGVLVNSRNMMYRLLSKANNRPIFEVREIKKGEKEPPFTNERISQHVWARYRNHKTYRPKNLGEVITRMKLDPHPETDYPNLIS